MNPRQNEPGNAGQVVVTRWTRPRPALWWPALLVCVWLACLGSVQAESTQTVEEFIAQKAKWSSLEGATLQIEGRYSIFSPTQLRMERCDLEFVLARAFPNPAGDSKNVLIKGRIEKRDGNKLVFVVSELVPQTSDLENFRSLRGKIPSNKPEDWYKLADWGAHRGMYYRDEELKKEAVEAFRQGVLAEHRKLSPATPAALRELALKLASRGADPPLQLEFRHEAFWLEYNALRKDNREGDGGVLTELSQQIPGTDQPLTAEDEAARQLYLKSPLVTFKDGDADQRKKYARAFYVEILKNRIVRDAAADGKNGYSIATRIEDQLPEYRVLAPEYRLKEQAYHLGRVGALSRKELSELVSKFEPLEIPEFVLALKTKWMAEKAKQVDSQSAIELVDLGDDYLIILNDQTAAIRYYQKAYAASPGTQAISDWLTEHGMVLHRNEWIPKGMVPPVPDDPIAAAVRAGQVRPGMTTEQVKSALGVEPTRKTRVATSGHLQEWWVFEDHGLSIQFTRRRRPETALVTKVMTLTTPSKPTTVEPENPSGTGGF